MNEQWSERSLRDAIATAIRSALDGRCSVCHRPHASDDDWAKIPEGEGEHLCWEPDDCGWRELVPLEQVAADAVLVVIDAEGPP